MVGTVRLVRLVGPVLFLAGLAALIEGFLQSQATLSLFLIFPIVTATGAWAFLGIVLMVAGFFLLFFARSPVHEGPFVSAPAAARSPQPPVPPSTPESPPRRWGGVVFLGPIPVVFGSDQKVTQWMLIVGVLLFVALVVLTVIALRGI